MTSPLAIVKPEINVISHHVVLLTCTAAVKLAVIIDVDITVSCFHFKSNATIIVATVAFVSAVPVSESSTFVTTAILVNIDADSAANIPQTLITVAVVCLMMLSSTASLSLPLLTSLNQAPLTTAVVAAVAHTDVMTAIISTAIEANTINFIIGGRPRERQRIVTPNLASTARASIDRSGKAVSASQTT